MILILTGRTTHPEFWGDSNYQNKKKTYMKKEKSSTSKTMIRGIKTVVTVYCLVPGLQNIGENNVDALDVHG